MTKKFVLHQQLNVCDQYIFSKIIRPILFSIFIEYIIFSVFIRFALASILYIFGLLRVVRLDSRLFVTFCEHLWCIQLQANHAGRVKIKDKINSQIKLTSCEWTNTKNVQNMGRMTLILASARANEPCKYNFDWLEIEYFAPLTRDFCKLGTGKKRKEKTPKKPVLPIF